ALTLVEEKLEGDPKVILERQGGRDWLLSRLRAYEKDTGDTLLRAVADDTELRPSDLIEAWSHLGQSYLLGRSTFGAPLQNGRMAEMLQSLASAGLSSAVNAESQFWNMVQARAQKLGELHAAGKLDATMAAELESQLGIGAGTDVEALTQVGGKARAGSTENSPDSAGKKANASELDTETYSVRSVDSPLSLEDAQARLRSLSGTPLTTADGLTATVSNATAAKMTSASATRKSASMQAHLAAIGAFQELFSRGRITETKPDRNNDVNIKAIHRVKAMMLLEGQPHEVKFTVKEFARADQGGRIYSIESVETEDASERKRVDSTVLPEGGPTSTPQSEARVQEWASNDESQATHSLVTPPANTDPRLVKAFPDWPHGWDEHGFPNPPRTLSDEDPLLKITRKKKTAILSPDHPLVQSGQLPADKDVPREAMRKAIADHFINQSQPLPQGVQPVIYAMGGGGGSGKSSLIAILQDQGVIPADGYVLINTDEIKKFIPEYDDIIRAGDGRAANVVQLESVDIANQIMDRLNSGGEKIRHHIIFDSTLANANETRRLISLWKAAGFKVHLVGIIIDPKEALTRAFGRILDEKRWVPAAALAKAHQGFNAALKSYLSEVDEAEIYDNSGDTPVVVARKTSTSPDVMVVEPKIWNSIDQRSHETLSR
ncbi:MAG: zeta toxin family protein, partial [Prosthecobacter sp.]